MRAGRHRHRKREPIPKIEIFRAETGKPALFPDDDNIIAVATDIRPPFPRPGCRFLI